MSKILYFYPENPMIHNQGNNARAFFLLTYFQHRNIEVDFIGECSNSFSDKDIEILKKKKFIKKGWLLKKNIKSFQHYLFKIFPKKIHKSFLSVFSKPRYKAFLDFNRTKKGHLEDFKTILKKNNYEIIIVSYVYWAPLIKECKELTKKIKLIIDTHDFISAQLQNKPNFNLGIYFSKEIRNLKQFDEIWAISNEEHFLFSQFLPEKKVELIPHGSKTNFQSSHNHPSIDLLYVASDNQHNIDSISWFFQHAYPLLPKSINITIIGQICNTIADYKNVQKIVFAESLETYYNKTKICLCPMLSGTGLKIKVVEALSYGIPVVCNSRGVDGLLNKTNNGCLATESEKKFAELIVKLLSDDVFYHKNKKNAETFFTASLSNEIVYTKLDLTLLQPPIQEEI